MLYKPMAKNLKMRYYDAKQKPKLSLQMAKTASE